MAAHLQGGELIALRGQLGSGKTVFVRGVAEGLEIAPRKVRSPTFTLINEYSGGRLPLYHIDLYRLRPSEPDRLALREYMYGDGVCVIEWFEHLGEFPARLDVAFTFAGGSRRRIVATAYGPHYGKLLQPFRER